MRSRAERVSRALVGRYPKAWRERYGDEMLALIDDAGSTWKHALDLAMGCADTWLRAATRSTVPINWIAVVLGSVSVRVGSVIAIHFGLIPPAPLRQALQGAFALLMVFCFVSIFLLFLLGFARAFRKAWNQWFGMMRGDKPEPIQFPFAAARVKAITDLGPTRRQVRMLTAMIIVIAVGADISTPDKMLGEFLHLPVDVMPFPVIPWLTQFLLVNVRTSLWSLRALRLMVSDRRRPSRVE